MKRNMGYIENIQVNKDEGKIYFTGFSFIEGINISKDINVKKSLILDNGIKKYYVPTENTLREDITNKFGNNKYNYDYSGFVGFIDNMKPLDEGIWNLSIWICVNNEDTQANLNFDESLKNINFEELKTYFKNENKIIRPYLNNNKVFIKSYKNKESINLDKYLCSKNYNMKDNNIKRKIIDMIFQVLYKIEKNFKVKKNRVVFLSDSRIDFTGNFEFIYKELVNRGGYDIKYILKPSISTKKTLKEKLQFIYYICTSKYILLDDYYPQIYKYNIKKEIEVIQLWHACGAFKTFGFSRLGKEGGPNSKSRNHKNYTKAIVSSDSIKKHYAEAFGISEDKVISTGIPRTDIFFDKEYINNKTNEIYKKYPLLKDKKVILFAPTFRGGGQATAHYDFDKLEIDKLREGLGDEYVIIMKLHPFIKESINISEENKDFILDLSSEREVNDLLFISDIMITDYSSICFEYSLLNRPMIFFTYDLEEYIEKRDFYYPFESFVPGPIVRTTEEIIDTIKNSNFDLNKVQNFREKFLSSLDGKSTKRVVDELLKI